MFDIIDAIYEEGKQHLREIEKHLNRQFIYHVLAPQKVSEAKAQRKAYGKEVADLAQETKSSIKRIADHLDTSIKGEWSQKIQTVLADEANRYDKL